MATLAELIAKRNQLVAEMADAGGVTHVSIDSMSVSTDYGASIAAVDAEIARLRQPNSSFGMRTVKLVPPGGGGL